MLLILVEGILIGDLEGPGIEFALVRVDSGRPELAIGAWIG